jgi:hypothetical protein
MRAQRRLECFAWDDTFTFSGWIFGWDAEHKILRPLWRDSG